MRRREYAWLQTSILVFATASIPVWPAFIALAALIPPGISLIPPAVALGDLLLSMVAAIVVIAMLVHERLPLPPLFWPIAAYVGSSMLATVLGFDPITGLMMSLALVLGMVFHMAIIGWYNRPGVACAIYGTFLLTGTVVSLLGIILVGIRRPVALYAMVHGRATSTFVVPGEFAGYLLLLIPTALGIVLVTQSRLLRWLGIAALLSGVPALAVTYSRAGWLGAAVGTAFFAYGCRGAISRIPGFFAFVGSVIAVLIASLVLLFHGHHNPSEDFARLPIWRAGVRVIVLFPLTGVGPGSFRHVYPLVRPVSNQASAFHAHNTFLTVFAETGVIGVALLGFVWFRFIRVFRTAFHDAQPRDRTLALAIAAGLVATWTQGLFDFVQVVVLGCWLPFLGLALAALRPHERHIDGLPNG